MRNDSIENISFLCIDEEWGNFELITSEQLDDFEIAPDSNQTLKINLYKIETSVKYSVEVKFNFKWKR